MNLSIRRVVDDYPFYKEVNRSMAFLITIRSLFMTFYKKSPFEKLYNKIFMVFHREKFIIIDL